MNWLQDKTIFTGWALALFILVLLGHSTEAGVGLICGIVVLVFRAAYLGMMS